MNVHQQPSDIPDGWELDDRGIFVQSRLGTGPWQELSDEFRARLRDLVQACDGLCPLERTDAFIDACWDRAVFHIERETQPTRAIEERLRWISKAARDLAAACHGLPPRARNMLRAEIHRHGGVAYRGSLPSGHDLRRLQLLARAAEDAAQASKGRRGERANESASEAIVRLCIMYARSFSDVLPSPAEPLAKFIGEIIDAIPKAGHLSQERILGIVEESREEG